MNVHALVGPGGSSYVRCGSKRAWLKMAAAALWFAAGAVRVAETAALVAADSSGRARRLGLDALAQCVPMVAVVFHSGLSDLRR